MTGSCGVAWGMWVAALALAAAPRLSAQADKCPQTLEQWQERRAQSSCRSHGTGLHSPPEAMMCLSDALSEKEGDAVRGPLYVSNP